jgi:excisionase family DNA binding protein
MGEWLSLREAAEMLGVHPGTVRNWADQGYLPVRRTKGGHRRFRRDDIELWRQSQESDGGIELGLIGQNMVRHTRMQIGEGRLENESWYQKLDEEARTQYRQSGRSLIQGLIVNLSSSGRYQHASRSSLAGLRICLARTALRAEQCRSNPCVFIFPQHAVGRDVQSVRESGYPLIACLGGYVPQGE